MSSVKNLASQVGHGRWLLGAAAGLLALSVIAGGHLRADDEVGKGKKAHKVGSGLKADVQTQVIGKPLSEDDARNVSILGTHLLHQVNRARRAIDGGDKDAANVAIDKALKVSELIHQLLPKTRVATTVKDAGGKVIYEDSEDVQADVITVLRQFIEVEITRPILESKKDAAEEEGREFEGHELIESDLIVNLSYIERRLHVAKRSLANDDDDADADEALALAQSRGTEVKTIRIESPLQEAREALEFAHGAAKRQQYHVAEANLRIARGYLALYQQVVADDSAKSEIEELNKEIETVTHDITNTTPATHEKTTGSVERFRDRVAQWWKKASQAKPSTETSPKDKDSAKPESK